MTGEDLARVRVAPGAEPLWEVLLSAHLLGKSEGALVFDRWRGRMRPALVPRMRPLLALAPPWGYSPDFLTPPISLPDIDAAVENVLSTPRRRLREDIDQLAVGQAPAAWAGAVRRGEPAALRQLGNAVTAYHRRAVDPYRDQIDSSVRAERDRLARAFLTGGVEQVLNALRPFALWEAPVLTLPSHPAERDIHLAGRGLTLLPSFFCWRAPTTLKNAEGPHVLVYPIQHDLAWLAPRKTDSASSLAALIGRTRATVLMTLAQSPATTSELARLVRISLPSASEHTTVLRDAGLIVSHRYSTRVHHHITALGTQLCTE
ncbi:ArsR/SmtB family transcription factor [Streptomyces tauricus]|uniref:ArsR/SmtB family transcription factor n=1 Tax=Streptomyces tauricus TaxID=68274 RepID=UPI003806A9FE